MQQGHCRTHRQLARTRLTDVAKLGSSIIEMVQVGLTNPCHHICESEANTLASNMKTIDNQTAVWPGNMRGHSNDIRELFRM